MKLKNRIIVGFMMVILVPLLLFAAALFGISETQHRNAANNESAQETSYDITISDTGSSQARIQIMTKDLFFSSFISSIVPLLTENFGLSCCSDSSSMFSSITVSFSF